MTGLHSDTPVIDLALTICKFAGLLLAGLFGAYGLLVKFKDENHRITRSGRNALILIIVSTLLGTVSAAFEVYRDAARQRTALERQAAEALQTAKRTEAVITEIDRTLQPISQLSVSFWIDLPTRHPLLKPYVARFEKALPNTLAQIRATGAFSGAHRGIFEPSGEPQTIELQKAAPLSPDPIREGAAFWLFNSVEVSLQLTRTPVKLIPGKIQAVSFKPDLVMGIDSERGEPGTGHHHTVEYVLDGRYFELQGVDVVSDSRFWATTGRIVSIPDLAGTQLWISVRTPLLPEDHDLESQFTQLEAQMSLNAIVLNFGPARDVVLQRNDFTVVETQDQVITYVVTFPQSLGELYQHFRGLGDDSRNNRYRELAVRRIVTFGR